MYKGRNTAVRLSWDLSRSSVSRKPVELWLDLCQGEDTWGLCWVLFLRRLGNSDSSNVRILFEVEVRDEGSVTRKNIYLLQKKEFGVDPRILSSRIFRNNYMGVQVPQGEE